jgi:hydroxyethylthiazole kinase-like uncharacterized protein yjeF
MALPILTCDEVRRAERAAASAGVSMWDLMARAGEAGAEVLLALHPSGPVVVLAGPGNNGGDAFVAARLLRAAGREVRLYELAGQARSAEAERASREWGEPGRPLQNYLPAPGDIVLDGLYGAGLSRPLSGEAAPIVEAVNTLRLSVVAIDIPSGVHGDRGRLDGPAFRATDTVTFGAAKPAHVLHPAAGLCGRVHVMPIGFEAQVDQLSGRLHENSPDLWRDSFPWPGHAAHKHQRGRLHVVSGGLASTGAARLAAKAGLRVGAGVVTVLCPPSALIVVASSLTAVMTASFMGPDELLARTERSSAVLIGPAAGVNEATRRNVEALARAGRSLVLDADALTVFAGEAAALGRILSAPAVLTPHTGEFERLFPGLLDAAQNRIEAARQAATQTCAVILLKGPDTVVAAPDGRAVVNTHATPFLATAGSGDTLAGIIAGLMAQGMDSFDAACAGAWLHGDAGLRIGPGLTAEDLDPALRETLKDLYEAKP